MRFKSNTSRRTIEYEKDLVGQRDKNKTFEKSVIFYGLQLCLLIATLKAFYDFLVLPSEYIPALRMLIAVLSIVSIVGLSRAYYRNKHLNKFILTTLFVVILYFIIEGTAVLVITLTDNNLMSRLGIVLSNLSFSAYTFIMATLAVKYLQVARSN
jgi:hypothetical protein